MSGMSAGLLDLTADKSDWCADDNDKYSMESDFSARPSGESAESSDVRDYIVW